MEDNHSDRRRRPELLMRLLLANGDPRPDLEHERPLSSTDVATLFQMTDRSIRLQAAKGDLPHSRTLGGGRLLFPADEIAELYAQHCSKAVSFCKSTGRKNDETEVVQL